MLFVEDSDGSIWLATVELMLEREPYDMVLCLYHDSMPGVLPQPFRVSQQPEHLERVTTYPDESEPPCSARARVTSGLLDSLRPHIGEFEDWGDNLTIYPVSLQSWAASFIPHERVVLVRDVQLHGFLNAAADPRHSRASGTLVAHRTSVSS